MSSYHHELILLLALLDAFEQGTALVQTTEVSSISATSYRLHVCLTECDSMMELISSVLVKVK